MLLYVRELVRAVQKRNKSLEEEYKELSTRISELNAQLQNKEKVIICMCVCACTLKLNCHFIVYVSRCVCL